MNGSQNALISELVRAADPLGHLDRVQTTRIHFDLKSTLLGLSGRSKLFKGGRQFDLDPGRDRVVVHDVPRPGTRVVVAGGGATVIHADGRVTARPQALRRMRKQSRHMHLAIPALQMSRALPPLQVFEQPMVQLLATHGKTRMLSVAEICCMFGRAALFYATQVHHLQHPQTKVQRLSSSDPVFKEVYRAHRVGKPKQYIGLKVRYPEALSTHHSKMVLLFSKETMLLELMRYKIRSVNKQLVAWQQTTRYHSDPELGVPTPGRRRAVSAVVGMGPDLTETADLDMDVKSSPMKALTWRPGCAP